MTIETFGYSYLDSSQLSPELVINQNLLANYILHKGIVDRDLTAPPGSPADGDAYIPAATATGVWAGHEDHIAYWFDEVGVWKFLIPEEGIQVYVNDEDLRIYFLGGSSGWDVVAGSGTVTNVATAGTVHGLTLTGGPITGTGTITLGGTWTPSGSISWNSQLITNLADPVSAQDAATKAYVDALVQGLSPKNSVRVATTANGTLATAFENGQTVDGITLVTGNRILIKDQSAPAENGIYVVAASGAPARSADMDSWAEVPSAFVFVQQGTVNADTGWTCTSNIGGTLNTTAIAWTQFSSAGSYTAGTGLQLIGSQFSIDSTVATLTGSQTLTNKQMTTIELGHASDTTFTRVSAGVAAIEGNTIVTRNPAIQSVASSATVTPTFADDLVKITAQAAALALANPTGTAIPGLGMVIRIKDNGTARAISYDTQYRAIGVTLPTTTVISKTVYLAMVYNSDDTKWDVLAVGQEA